MKEFINEIRMQGLILKQKAIVWYFIISLCLLCITAEAPIWAITFLVLNFGNAARPIRKVPFKENE